MKARFCIKKFLNKWATIVLKTGLKITVKIKEVIDNMGISTVKYEAMGSRELRTLNRSDIVEIYA